MKNLPGRICFFAVMLLFVNTSSTSGQQPQKPYIQYVQECVDNLIEFGTDRYGEKKTPMLVSILDVDSKTCPEVPEKFDEYYRVTRRDRRNPAGSNLYTDQATLKSMYLLSSVTGKNKYKEFANTYSKYVMTNLVDEKDFFWWGIHRHYDVYTEEQSGHNGNHHEIHALTHVDWEHLWQIDSEAVQKEIEAIWKWHVIDKNTGEINRHGDGKPGCDFSMSAGAYLEAFSFLYSKTRENVWLDRALFLADYYWKLRNPDTNLFPERPNAGMDRFDGSCFVTPITGLYCHSLLKAYELTGNMKFKQQAITYLKAYQKYGFDESTGKYWGALQLDGSPIPGPRVYTNNVDSSEGYEASQPRGHLDLWEPYMAGYQYAIYTAQAYAYAYHLDKTPELLKSAVHFSNWIENTPIGTIENEETWYKGYSQNEGQKGTYADKYGRAISFFIHLYILTGEQKHLNQSKEFANEAIEKLFQNGLFKGHPAKPYYEAMDGVGYLLYALIELDQVLVDPEGSVSKRQIAVDRTGESIALDNW